MGHGIKQAKSYYQFTFLDNEWDEECHQVCSRTITEAALELSLGMFSQQHDLPRSTSSRSYDVFLSHSHFCPENWSSQRSIWSLRNQKKRARTIQGSWSVPTVSLSVCPGKMSMYISLITEKLICSSGISYCWSKSSQGTKSGNMPQCLLTHQFWIIVD